MPFGILTPGYLPEGYQADEYKGEQYAMLLEGFQQRRRGEAPVRLIRGVSLTYYDRTPPADTVRHVIQFEQTLGRKGETIVDPGEREPNEDIGGFEADVWRAWNLSGEEIIVLIWEDAFRGVRFEISGFVSKEEMLRIARSLQ
ncbi:MAG: DUF4367 domain-containing protein [Chloroflexota bacterium]|nr:DUF4367 domain-containing protein [Chloroflexota bacterium]